MLDPLRRYATFSGRSQRREFWLFILFVVVVGAVARAVDHTLGFDPAHVYEDDLFAFGRVFPVHVLFYGPISFLSGALLFLPTLAVTIRRLHDADRSGWWVLIQIIPIIGTLVMLIFLVSDGTHGSNRFGPDPKRPVVH
jgi:uncharacterized membrane protein YhaH (DUF805 family)